MYRLGLDIGATKTVIGIIDERGTVGQCIKQASSRALQTAETPADSLALSIREFCQQTGIKLKDVEGVGIGFPGVMDRPSETIASCPNLQALDGLPLGRDLVQRLGVPVFLENDVNLIALGEHFKRRGKNAKVMACIFVGSGIGCGLVLDGQLYTGADGAAGEFGHTVIEPAGLPCTCGGQGCLDMYCSGKALAIQAASILGRSGDADGVDADREAVSWSEAERVIKAAKEGHAAALEALHRAFRYLGLGVVNLANILNPRLIILGGGIVAGWPEGVDIVREVVRTRARTVIRDRLVIDRPVLGEEAALVGASILVENSLASQG